MPISDWLDLMPLSLTYEPIATYDSYGKPATYGTAVTYRCRVQWKTQRVVSRVNGAEVLSSGNVWVNGYIPGISVDDKFTLPSGDVVKALAWDHVMDEVGNHHTKSYF